MKRKKSFVIEIFIDTEREVNDIKKALNKQGIDFEASEIITYSSF